MFCEAPLDLHALIICLFLLCRFPPLGIIILYHLMAAATPYLVVPLSSSFLDFQNFIQGYFPHLQGRGVHSIWPRMFRGLFGRVIWVSVCRRRGSPQSGAEVAEATV